MTAPAPTVPTTSSSTTASKGDVWWRLFGCETGHTYDPAIVSRTGKFRGAFQFDLATYQSNGGSGDPAADPYEAQLAVAKRLHAARGWHPWPTCARRLGLL